MALKLVIGDKGLAWKKEIEDERTLQGLLKDR